MQVVRRFHRGKQVMEHFEKIIEGKAEILFPKDERVFYNPVQQFNRDLSIACINTWSKIFLKEKSQKWEIKKENKVEKKNTLQTNFTILEALSASGLRSIRYAKELENVSRIVANDLSSDAVASIKRNIEHNGIKDDLVVANLDDACGIMYASRNPQKQFDVVDLDPYGSATPFIDAAVQSVSDGGLLCVTCTDMAILGGSNHPETCFGKYGTMPVKSHYCHELGLRALLHTLQTSASRYKRYIVPMISCSIDFYVRVFVRVFNSANEVKRAACKTSMVYHCPNCKSFLTAPLAKESINGKSVKYGPLTLTIPNSCEECSSRVHVGGPLWSYPLYDKEFVKELLVDIKSSQDKYHTIQRMIGMVTVISEELDVPFYHTISCLSGTIHCNTPPIKHIFSALLNQGFQVSVSHCCSDSVKTNAPNSVVWDIMRCWAKKQNVNVEKHTPTSPAFIILSKEPSFEANFEPHPNANPESRKIKLVRFQKNPEKFWGPKAKAGTKRSPDSELKGPIKVPKTD